MEEGIAGRAAHALRGGDAHAFFRRGGFHSTRVSLPVTAAEREAMGAEGWRARLEQVRDRPAPLVLVTLTSTQQACPPRLHPPAIDVCARTHNVAMLQAATCTSRLSQVKEEQEERGRRLMRTDLTHASKWAPAPSPSTAYGGVHPRLNASLPNASFQEFAAASCPGWNARCNTLLGNALAGSAPQWAELALSRFAAHPTVSKASSYGNLDLSGHVCPLHAPHGTGSTANAGCSVIIASVLVAGAKAISPP